MIITNRIVIVTSARILVIAALVFSQCAAARQSAEAERQSIRDKAQEVLQELYVQEPDSRPFIENAAGYGVFSNFGMKLMFAGGGKGKGIIVDRERGREIFMKMIEVQAGLGFGIKKFNVVFVFSTPTVLDEFVNQGWEFGGQVTAAAKSETEGAALAKAISIKPGIWMYQLTDKGVAAELTGKGSRFYMDDELN